MRKIKKLFLLSNSMDSKGKFLGHAEKEIKDFISGTKSIVFIPYALRDRAGYAKITEDYFKKLGIEAKSIRNFKDPKRAVQDAEAIYVGGGNTFRLLNELYKVNILETLRKRVNEGMPYIGSSAGINVVCPTVKTTNDMPIIEPPSLNALGIIDFQINPHYLDPDPNSKHLGETRETRIREFHEENKLPVVGLREGAWLKIENNEIYLGGENGARVFRQGKEPKEYKTCSLIEFSA